ncbi:AAA family ATPase [Nonomuraea sp. NPDC050783]|uniref:nSTAND1 domain-containing NTPase n=1 Tax=Nonomuraea sp. NPDC050783 TaxID=3154634 RepID=UPI0034673520
MEDTVGAKSRTRLEVRSLLLGLVFGFGTNLVTANPETWPEPLPLIDRYAPVWLVLGVSAALAHEAIGRLREKRRILWQGPGSPYAGLSPFAADRAKVFFGRDTEVARIVARLTKSGVNPSLRFIPVVGPSGSGKSSLIHAGLIPRLSSRWSVLGSIRPGSSPFTALAECLTRREPPSGLSHAQVVARTARLLREEASRLDDKRTAEPSLDALLSALAASRGGGDRTLLVIDQFEELVTLTSPPERSLFLSLLHAALSSDPALHIVAALRPEALSEFDQHEHGPLFARPFSINPLDDQKLRDIVVKPAAAAGLVIEDEVLDQMLAEATVGDALPLLSHLLERLHTDFGQDGVITADAFNRAGRVVGAITRHAEEVHQGLRVVYSDEEINRTLLRFVIWGDREPVRQSVARQDLSETSQTVAEEFRAARLIVDVDNGNRLELAHDALIRQWDRFQRLIADSADELRRLKILRLRAEEWAASGRSQDDLLRGQVLREATELLSIFPESETVQAYLEASHDDAKIDVSLQATAVAERAQSIRDQDRPLAIALAKAAVEELSRSEEAVLALWGLMARPALTRFPIGHSDRILSLAWLPDGSGLMSISRDASICSWDLHGNLIKYETLPHDKAGGRLQDAKLSINGSRAITENRDSSSSLWDMENTRELGHSAPDPLTSMDLEKCEWSPDGNLLAGQVGHKDILIWTLRTTASEDGKLPGRTIPVPYAQRLSWAPDQSRLAVLGDEQLLVIDLSADQGTLSISVDRHCDIVAWSPDSRSLLVAERPKRRRNMRIRIIKADTGHDVHSWWSKPASAVAWSPDGRFLAVAIQPRHLNLSMAEFEHMSDDDTGRLMEGLIELWDDQGNVLRRKPMEDEHFTSLSWSPNSRFLAFCAEFGSKAFIWDIDNDEIFPTLSTRIRAASWSPDHSRAIVAWGFDPGQVYLALGSPGQESLDVRQLAGDEGVDHRQVTWASDSQRVALARDSVEIWNSYTALCERRLHYEQSMLSEMAWSPDGRYLATSSHDWWMAEDSQLLVWDVDTGRPAATMARIDPHSGPIAWSPDGSKIAASDGADTMRIWAAHTGDIALSIECPRQHTTALAWSPAGGLLAVGTEDGQVRLWDTQTGDLTHSCLGHESAVQLLAWSSTGTFLASAADNTVRLWSPVTGKALAVLDATDSSLLDLTWSPDERQLTLIAGDNTIRTWTLPDDAEPLMDEVSGFPLPPLTPQDRSRYGLP